jgi:hypothetical protein
MYLGNAGILSFEKVLLPAIAFAKEQALAKLQAKIQRDRPELRSAIVACCKAIYTGMRAASAAAEQSRLQQTKVNR